MNNQSKDNYLALRNYIKKIKEENIAFKQLMFGSFQELVFNSILQLNRIHKSVITHLSHYLLIIREICNILFLEFNRPPAI